MIDRLIKQKNLRFAGQITGVEGYVESAATGMLSALITLFEANGNKLKNPPQTTCMGALLTHITKGSHSKNFQPMNINFGLLPAILNIKSKKDRFLAYTNRAKQDWNNWLKDSNLIEGSKSI